MYLRPHTPCTHTSTSTSLQITQVISHFPFHSLLPPHPPLYFPPNTPQTTHTPLPPPPTFFLQKHTQTHTHTHTHTHTNTHTHTHTRTHLHPPPHLLL